MTAPYRVGDPVVFLELDDDGMRASQVAVLRVEPVGNAWGVETTLGRDVVNEHGEGGRIVPMDGELAQEFAERGSRFVVRSKLHDVEKDLDHRSTGVVRIRSRPRRIDRDYAPSVE